MSSAYQSMIDAALRNAQAMASTGVEKTASDTNNFYKEASELANALEYMAISSVNDGSPAGTAQSDMIKDFFKQASKQRSGVPHGSTAATGTQGVAPSNGKLKLNHTQNSLQVSASPDSTGHQMLESYKQASLYDILMGKQADSPAQYTADQYTNVTNANENSVRGVLDTNESAANFQKRHVHGDNIRSRLAEAFSHTNDSLSDATVQQIFPQAYASGGLKKTASGTRNRLNKMAAAPSQFLNTIGGRALAGGGLGALVGGGAGYMSGGDAQSALLGAGLGAAGGAAAGGLMQRAAAKGVGSLKGEQALTDQALALSKMRGNRVPGKGAMSKLEKDIAARQKALEGTKLTGSALEKEQQALQALQSRLAGSQSLQGMNAAQIKELRAGEQMAGLLGNKPAELQALALQRAGATQAARQGLQGGLGAQLGVGAGAAALGGLGAGMMAGGDKMASSPLSARSRLRQMQRGL